MVILFFASLVTRFKMEKCIIHLYRKSISNIYIGNEVKKIHDACKIVLGGNFLEPISFFSHKYGKLKCLRCAKYFLFRIFIIFFRFFEKFSSLPTVHCSVARLQCPPLSCRNSSTFPTFAQSPTRAVLYQTNYTDLVEDMLHKLGGRC